MPDCHISHMNTPIQTKKEIKCRNCKCKFNTETEGNKKKRVCGICLNFYFAYRKPKMSDEVYNKILLMANMENDENAS